MILKIVSEEDESDFVEIEVEDSLIEEIRAAYEVKSDGELMEILRDIVMAAIESEEGVDDVVRK